MRRVRTIHAVRLLSAPVSAAALLVLALWVLGREVWVAKVFENMPSLTDLPSALAFFTGAFIGTDVLVQALTLVILGSVIWLARECARILSSGPRFA